MSNILFFMNTKCSCFFIAFSLRLTRSEVNSAVKMDEVDELDFNPLFKALQVIIYFLLHEIYSNLFIRHSKFICNLMINKQKEDKMT